MDALKAFVWRVADRTADFLDEAQFRFLLAWRVLAGRVPVEERRREFADKAPVLLECHDWTDGRRLFSVLVWPPGGDSQTQAVVNHERRVRELTRGFNKACADRAWSVLWTADYGLQWDPQREVWTADDGFCYEPPAQEERSYG